MHNAMFPTRRRGLGARAPMTRARYAEAMAVAALAVAASACATRSDADDSAAAVTRAGSHGPHGPHGPHTPVRAPRLTAQTSGTTNRLQAISPVNARVAWASGVGGSYAITTDGGRSWRAGVVPGAEALQFRDVEAVSERVAYLLAAGVGPDSRIYKTVDGGATWTLLFQNQDPNGFNDCFAFFSSRRAIAMADAIATRFPVLRTLDGERWTDIGDRLPAAQAGEAAFAASGTCVATFGTRHAWIATGGAPEARVLATRDGGQSWTAHPTPVAQGTSTSGGFSVAFRDRWRGILAGGELGTPTQQLTNNFARSRDGGASWTLATPVPFVGAVFGVSYALGDPGRAHRLLDEPAGEHETDARADDNAPSRDALLDSHHRARVSIVATGPGGAAWSSDEGDTWSVLDGVANYWAVAFADEHTGWLVGTDGRILRIDL